MISLSELGTVSWSADEMRAALSEFAELYPKRPIQDNSGGMKSPHMFLSWFVFRKLQPTTIIESGVYKGQGTWLFEQACPDAEFHCVDLNLDQLQYRSEKASYYNVDFAEIDWSDLPKESTLLFFDDHQNAYQRLIHAKWFGFQHFLFEDNYPSQHGDCYSLKKAFSHAGFVPEPPKKRNSLKSAIRGMLRSSEVPAGRVVPANEIDAKYLLENMESFRELPPVFRPAKTRWGTDWDEANYSTPAPLLTSVQEPYQQVYLDEAVDYTWMCYVKLKG